MNSSADSSMNGLVLGLVCVYLPVPGPISLSYLYSFHTILVRGKIEDLLCDLNIWSILQNILCVLLDVLFMSIRAI